MAKVLYCRNLFPYTFVHNTEDYSKRLFFAFLNAVPYFAGGTADVVSYLSQLILIILNIPVITHLTCMVSEISTVPHHCGKK